MHGPARRTAADEARESCPRSSQLGVSVPGRRQHRGRRMQCAGVSLWPAWPMVRRVPMWTNGAALSRRPNVHPSAGIAQSIAVSCPGTSDSPGRPAVQSSDGLDQVASPSDSQGCLQRLAAGRAESQAEETPRASPCWVPPRRPAVALSRWSTITVPRSASAVRASPTSSTPAGELVATAAACPGASTCAAQMLRDKQCDAPRAASALCA